MLLAVFIAATNSVCLAVELRPRDLVVLNAFGRLVRVDPSDGSQTAIPSDAFEQPTDVILDAAGNIIVTDFGGSFEGSSGAIYRVNPVTGATTTISTGGLLVFPTSSAFDAAGNLIVVQQGSDAEASTVLKINPSSGEQTQIASGPELFATGSTVLEPDGNFLVSNYQNSFLGGSSIVRVNATTGDISVVSVGGELDFGPHGIELDRNDPNTILVSHTGFHDPADAKLLAINRLTGSQTVISSEGLLEIPTDVTQDADGTIFVVEMSTHRVLAIDRLTGDQTIVSTGGLLLEPIALVAVIPEPSSMLLAGAGLATLVVWTRRKSRRRFNATNE